MAKKDSNSVYMTLKLVVLDLSAVTSILNEEDEHAQHLVHKVRLIWMQNLLLMELFCHPA